jgi:hypothetical protein
VYTTTSTAPQADGDEPALTHGPDVLDSQCQGIEQRALRIREGHTMLLEIGRSLDWVVLERHL